MSIPVLSFNAMWKKCISFTCANLETFQFVSDEPKENFLIYTLHPLNCFSRISIRDKDCVEHFTFGNADNYVPPEVKNTVMFSISFLLSHIRKS